MAIISYMTVTGTRLLEVTEVAFSAILDSHSQDTHTHNQPVKFEHVYSNAGLGYSNSTGNMLKHVESLFVSQA